MRLSLSLLMVAAWVAVPMARAQTVAIPPAAAPAAATPPVNARPDAGRSTANAVRPSRHSASRHSRSRPIPGTDRESAKAGKPGGVLALGATDITGNKELPKVMVIVPWKDSLGAGGVVKPSDSLLDEVLQPVDRGVFQRRIHYYGQLHDGERRPPGAKVAPVGDSH